MGLRLTIIIGIESCIMECVILHVFLALLNLGVLRGFKGQPAAHWPHPQANPLSEMWSPMEPVIQQSEVVAV